MPSRSALTARLAKLEAAARPALAGAYLPLIIICNERNDGETREAAILRECGRDGIPPTPPGQMPAFIVHAAWAPGSRPDPLTLEHQPETEQ